jgi:cyanophycinase-like exopeptidase
MIDEVRGCADCSAAIDLVVLDVKYKETTAADAKEWANDTLRYFTDLRGVNLIEVLLATARAEANTDEVVKTVAAAEVVLFSGGLQCDYIKIYRGTRVEKAIKAVY